MNLKEFKVFQKDKKEKAKSSGMVHLLPNNDQGMGGACHRSAHTGFVPFKRIPKAGHVVIVEIEPGIAEYRILRQDGSLEATEDYELGHQHDPFDYIGE